MIEQQNKILRFLAFYAKSGVAVTNLTGNARVRKASSGNLLVDAAFTEIGDGFYKYELPANLNDSADDYVCRFRTAGDVTDKDIPSMRTVTVWVDRIDTNVGSRPTAVAIRSEIDQNSVKLPVPTSELATPDDLQVTVVAAEGEGSKPYTVTSMVGGDPMEGVSVWITTTSDPTFNVVAGPKISDVNGETRFLLDSGHYFVHEQLSGFNFTTPTEITVL